MSNLKKGLQIYLTLQNNQMYLPDIQKEFKLNKEEIEVVKEFYDTRGMLGIEDEAVNNSNNINDNDDNVVDIDDDKCIVGWYEESPTSIIERMDSLDILNVSLMERYQSITSQITGPFLLSNPTTIIDKRTKQTIADQTEKIQIKETWTQAIIKHNILEIMIRDGNIIENKEVKPLGLYFPEGSDCPRVIFLPVESKEIREIELDNIRRCTKLKNRRFKAVPFSIEKYLKNKKPQYIILRVYPQAHVLDKLKKVFSTNLQVDSETADFVRVKIKTDSPMQYCKLLESYGKSVLVEEPKELQNQIIENAKECLAFYEKLQNGQELTS